MWKFLVKQQKIEVLEREVIADHQIAFVNLRFIFDGDWKKFHKVVQFSQCDETYNRVLGTDGLSCLLPAELHAGAVKMSVFGYDAENTEGLRATTVPVTLHIRPSGFVGDGAEAVPPSPDLYAQLLQKLEEKADSLQNGADGKDGLSAYEIALENGYSGTESEWLISLKGADGLPGQDGTDGANGKSAYELAVENGFAGTEEEFLVSLKGDKGDAGNSVELSIQNGALMWRTVDSAGTPTYMWVHLLSIDSIKGEEGESAYETAVSAGFEGTELEWLESLKGEKGESGEQGAPGIDGQDGASGKDGKDGEDGFSPTATVTKSGSVITISITDKNGTTSASLTEGADVDLTPYATLLYVDEQVQGIHTHDNFDVLNKITDSLWQMVYVNSHTHNNLLELNAITPADIENLHSGAFNAIKQLETQMGDIKTVLESIVEVSE